jgi:hypothetical protein
MPEPTNDEVLDIAHRMRRQTTNMQLLTLCDWVIQSSMRRPVSADKPVSTSVEGCAVCAARKAKDAQRKSKQRGKA